ncbi:MAG: ATP-binding protein [Nitrospiria bacterium]
MPISESMTKDRDSLALLKTLVASAPIGLAFIDTDLHYVHVNEALAAMSGLAADDHVGRTLRDVVPQLAPVIEPRLLSVLDTREPIINFDVTGETPGAPGERRSWLTSYYPIIADNRILGVGLIATDTTERKHIEESSRARARQQAAVAALGQRALAAADLPLLMDEAVGLVAQGLDVELCAILEMGTDGTLLLRAGTGWKAGLVGYATVDAGSKSQAGYTLSSDEPVIVSDLAGETRFVGSLLLQSHGVISGLSLVIGGRHRPYGVLAAHTRIPRVFGLDDIHFMQAVANILAGAIERSAAQEELLKASKLESIGLLAGGVAHDFNNMLTAILGNISLAKIALDPSSKVVERLTAATKAGLQAKNLTQQLLTFSSGGPPATRAIELGPLLREWTGFALRGSSLRPEYAMADTLWPVEADEGQIGQVIHNLVLNAQQSMSSGGVIWISAENVIVGPEQMPPLAPGRYLKIAIRDGGPGISPEHLLRIFDPFFTTKPSGTGLGLTTAYWIVNRHRGSITVESIPGEQTTFFIYLPASPNAKTSQPEEHEMTGSARGKILFMDDEVFIRDFVEALLTHYGYEVESAKDGSEAIERYRKALESGRPFDAAILDLTVPGGMGGPEAIKALRIIDPQVKALVSSGYTNDPVLADFQTYGFSGAVAKPYRAEQLEKALRALLRGSGGQTQDAA